MSDLQMDYMLIKRERLDALLRVVEAARYGTHDEVLAALDALDYGDE